MTMLEALQRAVKLAGGQSALARRIQVKQQTVHYWLSVGKKASADYARKIEEAVGGQVTRYELRPDVFGEPIERERAA